MNPIRKLIKFSHHKELRGTIKEILYIYAKQYFHLPIRGGDFIVSYIMYLSYLVPLFFIRKLYLESNHITGPKEFRFWGFTVKIY